MSNCDLFNSQPDEKESEPQFNYSIYEYLKGELDLSSPNSNLRGYREIAQEEITPSVLPDLGLLTYVSETTERAAISENNPDINDFSFMNDDGSIIMNSILQKIINNSPASLSGTTYIVPAGELNDTAFNKIKFTDNAIYIYIKSKTVADSYINYSEVETIYKATDDNKIMMFSNFRFFSDNQDFTGLIVEMSGVTIVDLYNKDQISYSRYTELNSYSPVTYSTSYIVGKEIIDGDVTISAGYGDDRDQRFEIYTSIGKLETRTNVVNEGQVDEKTSLHTDYYNSDNELIALESIEYDIADIALSTNNTMGSFVKNNPVKYSLKQALPLKESYAVDYDFINIVTSSTSPIYKSYYLYKKNIDGVSRESIPNYNGTDNVIDYINSFVDINSDIKLNTRVETIYDYTGYFTWIDDSIYFDGPAISIVNSLKETYETLYNRYWVNFRNETPDYTQLEMTESDLTILDSIKE